METHRRKRVSERASRQGEGREGRETKQDES